MSNDLNPAPHKFSYCIKSFAFSLYYLQFNTVLGLRLNPDHIHSYNCVGNECLSVGYQNILQQKYVLQLPSNGNNHFSSNFTQSTIGNDFFRNPQVPFKPSKPVPLPGRIPMNELPTGFGFPHEFYNQKNPDPIFYCSSTIDASTGGWFTKAKEIFNLKTAIKVQRLGYYLSLETYGNNGQTIVFDYVSLKNKQAMDILQRVLILRFHGFLHFADNTTPENENTIHIYTYERTSGEQVLTDVSELKHLVVGAGLTGFSHTYMYKSVYRPCDILPVAAVAAGNGAENTGSETSLIKPMPLYTLVYNYFNHITPYSNTSRSYIPPSELSRSERSYCYEQKDPISKRVDVQFRFWHSTHVLVGVNNKWFAVNTSNVKVVRESSSRKKYDNFDVKILHPEVNFLYTITQKSVTGKTEAITQTITEYLTIDSDCSFDTSYFSDVYSCTGSSLKLGLKSGDGSCAV